MKFSVDVAVELSEKRASLALDLAPLSALHLVRALHAAQRSPLPRDVAMTVDLVLAHAVEYFRDCPAVLADLRN